MITTAAAAVDEVSKINQSGFGARPGYAEFLMACEAAVIDGSLLARPDPGTQRREFWATSVAAVC